MKHALLLILILASSFAHAEGTRGGGSGCTADFMRAGYVVSDWLKTNGSSLKPAVNGDDFLTQIDPTKIISTTENLQYNGSPVDAFYDGQVIKVRCDRFQHNNTLTQERVVAHEIFRKMGLEGDKYEVSSQIAILAGAGVLGKSLSSYVGDYAPKSNYNCGIHIEADETNHTLITDQMRTNPLQPENTNCTFDDVFASSLIFTCVGNTCTRLGNGGSLRDVELKIVLIDDGNFIFSETFPNDGWTNGGEYSTKFYKAK